MAKRGDKRTGGRGIRATLAGAVLVLTALALPASPLLAGPAECLDHAARAEDGAAPRIEVLVADLEGDQEGRLTGRLVDVLNRTGAIRVFRPCQMTPLGKLPMASILGDEPWVSARRMLRDLDIEIFILGRVVGRDGWVRLWLVGNHSGRIAEATISDIWSKQLSREFNSAFAAQMLRTLREHIFNYIDLKSADNAAAFVKALALLDLTATRQPLFGGKTDPVFLDHLRRQSLVLWDFDDKDSALIDWWIAAHIRALRLSSRAGAPLLWARLQRGLGRAYARPGRRLREWSLSSRITPHYEPATAPSRDRLLLSVSHYRKALEVHTRRHDPFEWAEARAGIGFAYLEIARQEDDTVWLDRSIAAVQAALQEYTLEQAPVLRFETQVLLGEALHRFGERQPGTAALEQAVAFYRDMLAEQNEYVDAWRWALLKHDFSLTLHVLGERESGTARFREEIALLRQALSFYKHGYMLPEWAFLQKDLGRALQSLGERENRTDYLEQSLAAYRAALQFFENRGDQANAAATRLKVKAVQEMLAARQ